MNLEKIFEYATKKMQMEWERTRSAVSHSGLKGTTLENQLHSFFRDYLPESLGITRGEIVDSTGKSSRQLDIIIYDKAKTPKLFTDGDVRVIPIECVYSVIEVKAFLQQDQLDKIFENMESVRNLQKKAYYPWDLIEYKRNLYGKKYEIWPVNYFVFAFDSVDLKQLAKKIEHTHMEENYPEWKRIDTVCVLNNGIITNQTDDGMFDALPNPKSHLVVSRTKKPLLFFYTLIIRYLNQTILPNFRFNDYLQNTKF